MVVACEAVHFLAAHWAVLRTVAAVRGLRGWRWEAEACLKRSADGHCSHSGVPGHG